MKYRKAFTPTLIVITILAILGLVGAVIFNPNQFIKGLFLFSSVILTSILVTFFAHSRQKSKNDELRKYRKAAKQSQKRHRSKSQHQLINTQHKKIRSSINKRKVHPPHLRVIDGKKSTKNDPMSL